MNFTIAGLCITKDLLLDRIEHEYCSIALNLLLVVLFWFPTLTNIVYDPKEVVQVRTKVNRSFDDMVKIRVVIVQSVSIFTKCGSLIKNVIIILPIAYQIKIKMPGEKKKVLSLFIRSGKLYKLYASYLSIIFGVIV